MTPLQKRFSRAAQQNGLTLKQAVTEAMRMWLLKYGDAEAVEETHHEIGLEPKLPEAFRGGTLGGNLL